VTAYAASERTEIALKHNSRFLKLREVEYLTGLKRASIYRGARQGWFPKHVKISKRASAWVEDEVTAFMAARIQGRDQNSVGHGCAKTVNAGQVSP